jgi:DNA-binding CsgD family transcriptional regulator
MAVPDPPFACPNVQQEQPNGLDPSQLEHVAKLRSLGLTPRQAEVAFWIAQGKSNDELGVIVGASRHTVARHVEAILERLKLTNRVQIMLLILEALGWLHWPD